MKIEIEPLDHSNLDSAFELATQVFSKNSTLHRALGIDMDEYQSYLRPSFEMMVHEGLSLVARDERSAEIAGCLIASDFHRHLTAEISPGKFAPLVALTQALCDQYCAARSVMAGEVVLVDMAAVSETMMGKGLYKTLRKAAQVRALHSGFTRIVGELSSAATQHVVLNQLGHHQIVEVIFNAFEFENRRPFHGIKDPRSIILAEGELKKE